MTDNSLRDQIQQAITDNPVILFMKGTPDQPMCGFSARTVAILQSLEIVADTTGNIVLTRAIKDVQESVRSGESLSAPLKNHAVFPPMVVQMMAVGEDTGALDSMNSASSVAQLDSQTLSGPVAHATDASSMTMKTVNGVRVMKSSCRG